MTLEENVIDGGFGSSILEFSSELGIKKIILVFLD